MVDTASKTSNALSLREIAEYHEDAVASLKLFFKDAATLGRYQFRRPTEITEDLDKRIDETSLRSMLVTLASMEASFRVDYQSRCDKKLKDNLSRAFRKIYKKRQNNVALDEEIFEAWRTHVIESKALIGELRTAFKLRHWLAHGRYWQPKFGRTFDFDLVYDLAIAVRETLFEAEASA